VVVVVMLVTAVVVICGVVVRILGELAQARFASVVAHVEVAGGETLTVASASRSGQTVVACDPVNT
jgi:hypothetical protein